MSRFSKPLDPRPKPHPLSKGVGWNGHSLQNREKVNKQRSQSTPHQQGIAQKKNTTNFARFIRILFKRIPDRASHQRPACPLAHIRMFLHYAKLALVHLDLHGEERKDSTRGMLSENE